jgi:hypothetical protein
MWFLIAIGALFVILLIHGMIQQERYRLWAKYQEFLAERRRHEMEEQKKMATGKIKEMLRERRSAGLGETADAQAPPKQAGEANPAKPAEQPSPALHATKR